MNVNNAVSAKEFLASLKEEIDQDEKMARERLGARYGEYPFELRRSFHIIVTDLVNDDAKLTGDQLHHVRYAINGITSSVVKFDQHLKDFHFITGALNVATYINSCR